MFQQMIVRRPNDAEVPLTFGQRQLWFHQQMLPASPAYNVPFALRIPRAVDVAVLERAINHIVHRHEALRTRFMLRNGEPVQIIVADFVVRIEQESFIHLPLAERESWLQKRLKEEGQKPFDLQHLPLLRARLFQIDNDRCVLLLVFHHIVCDGWSHGVFHRELETLYQAYVRAEESPLPSLPVQYGDYAYWQRDRVRTGQLEADLNYWKAQLADLVPYLELPTDLPRPLVPRYEGASLRFEVSEGVTERLKNKSRRAGATLYMTLLAAYALLLRKYTRQDDIAIGAPIANRSLKELQGLIGYLANVLVMRIQFKGSVTFASLLERVKKTALGAYDHQELAFEQLVEQLKPQRSLNRAPLFQTMFVMQGGSLFFPSNRLLGGTPVGFDVPVAKFDLSLCIREQDRKLSVEFNYDTGLFSSATIERLQDSFLFILEQISRTESLLLDDVISTVTQNEQQEIANWNDTDIQYASKDHLHRLFEQQVRRVPEQIALVYERDRLTYSELNSRSNKLAHYLSKMGVGAETCVGVCMDRSLEMVVALLGILKAGGAYLPLDPEYPRHRLDWMLKDARVFVVLNQTKFNNLIDLQDGVRVLSLDKEWESVASESSSDCDSRVAGDNLAYVIYTSGSTGRPKGVMNRHSGISNRLLWMQGTYGLNEKDCVLQKTPYSFDVSVWEFFWPLITGATLVMARPGAHRDSSYLREIIREERITTIHFVPSMLQALLDQQGLHDCPSLKRVICSGEALGLSLKDRFCREYSIELHNLYGPTEAAVDVTSWACSDDRRPFVPIGRPIANTQIYCLDPTFNHAAVLTQGELCIAGDNLSRGYVGGADLTAEKFVPNPHGEAGSRLYRTGDLARYANDGAIEYLGRIDHQVKIRGHRIELGEIEEAIKQEPRVRNAAVIAHEGDSSEKQLVAYVVPNTDTILDVTELRSSLKTRLPGVMIPAAFVFLEKLPLNANGKLDRNSLLTPDGPRVNQTREHIAPRNLLEETLTQIWLRILRLDRIGVQDNFFDLGGHSLGLIQVQSDLQQKLQIEIPVIELFRLPTVRSLADYLQRSPTAERDLSTHGQLARHLDTSSETSPKSNAIAVIGMAGRFPGARDIEEFWNNLKNGVESISFFSDADLSAIPNAIRKDPNYVNAAGVLENADFFDADFFGFRRREAETTDPQHRVFLECAWEVLERAGYDPERTPATVGVFAGMGASGYWFDLQRSETVRESVNSFQLNIGNDKDHLPLRVSYKLNLKGPSISVQTACSTSLVAVHMACQSLLQRECKMAMAGGVSIRAAQKTGYVYQEGGISSPDGHCRAFDANAAGTVSGNGAGVVLLKRLADAVAEGDQIHAVILGSAINNDGAIKVGYTAPSIDGQAEVISQAHFRAGIAAETVTYVEAHGTATPLGDPIEIAALTQAFQLQTSKKQYCAIGSVKTNVGHLDAAAGIAGFIKAVLALKHGLIPPSLHFRSPNPKIDLAASPFYVNSELKEWTAPGPRRAGVSSFGIGGTNAHVILEESPVQQVHETKQRLQILPLSARSSDALQSVTLSLAEHLQNHSAQRLGDVAFTLQEGRKQFPFRRVILCTDGADAVDAIKTRDCSRSIAGEGKPNNSPIYFLFPGQGAQRVNMARGLYEAILSFRRQVDRCSDVLRPHLGIHLATLLFPASEDRSRCDEQLRETAFAQPALFVVEYALAKLWNELGIHPEGMLGHSLGEYVAACLSGVMSLEDALRLVTIRGQLMQNMPKGAMLAVHLPEQETRKLLSQETAIAAVNAPSLCVVSGPMEAIGRLESELEQRGIDAQRLRTSHAFHSPMMAPVVESLRQAMMQMDLKSPRIPFLSNVTGDWITQSQATSPGYWITHLLQTVRFSDGLGRLLKEPSVTLLEMGSGTLISLAKRRSESHTQISLLASLQSATADSDLEYSSFLRAVGTLWTEGRQTSWNILPRDEKCRRVLLPTYPFERQRYNIPAEESVAAYPSMARSDTKVASASRRNGSAFRALSLAHLLQSASTNMASASATNPRELVLHQLEVVTGQLELLRRRQ